MNKKRILFVGCSHTADSGFLKENQPKYHWPHLLSRHYNADLVNAGIGGSSNEEIFFRTCEAVLNSNFDLVIVMWTALFRQWVYFEQGNVDDFSIINKGLAQGLNSSNPDLIKYSKLRAVNFYNKYVDFKKWLLYAAALESFLKFNNINFVFIKGSENFLNDIISSSYNKEQGFSMSDEVKSMFDFDNRPDDYILSKLTALKTLIDNFDPGVWLNLHADAFVSMNTFDEFADDGMHVGPTANRMLADSLINHCNKYFAK